MRHRADRAGERPSTVAEPWGDCGPAAAAAALAGQPGLVWLDSAHPHGGYGRWSLVASDPRWTLTSSGTRLEWTDAAGRCVETGDPIDALASAIEMERLARPQRSADVPADLPFVGGAIGYLGFELGRHIERLPATTLDDVGAPDLAVGWYDAALAWDGYAQRGWLVGSPEGVRQLGARLDEGGDRECREARGGGTGRGVLGEPGRPVLQTNLTKTAYIEAVERARRYIDAGDIYQVNLSQRFSARLGEPAMAVYRRLREASPAPFAAYLSLGDVEVLSSSPERLLLAEGETERAHIETRPIKGTRRRSDDPDEDRRLGEELLASTKDRAEHVMIVDLERNDLGRVGEVGSVRVKEFAALESFAHVHHLTSTVTARRRGEVGLAELLRAMLPGGSISGAPKIRALEIIDELEPTVRGVYTGAIGYFSADGRVDLSVAIRTLTVRNGIAHMHVGGAIVHDSEPEAEYVETLDKARGMARALGVVLPDEHRQVGEVGEAADVATPSGVAR